MKKIFYLSNQYPEKRCILNIVKENVAYIKVLKTNKIHYIINMIVCKIKNYLHKRMPWDERATYKWNKMNGILHTFNIVNVGAGNWCVSFETTVPRTNYTCNKYWINDDVKLDQLTLKLVENLVKNNCIACIAISQSAYNIQLDMLSSMISTIGSENFEKIKNKTSVIYPPQKVFCSELDINKKFKCIETLRFLFIGNLFFRKGGKEIIEVLDKYHNLYSFHLTIISNFQTDVEMFNINKQEFEIWLAEVKEKSWITIYSNLDNKEVIELSKICHIGLLPTFAETFGFSVLEMQACGCPVITTDIRALPEINYSDWLCHLTKNTLGDAELMDNKIDEIRNELKYKLNDIIKMILELDQKELNDKAIYVRNKIIENHDPEKIARYMERIYTK